MVKHDLAVQLRGLEESHLKLEVRKSNEKLGNILADDFFEIGSSGKFFNRNDCINGGVSLDELHLHEFKIHPLAPDVILTTYFVNNKTKNKNSLRSSIWRLRNGKWQLYFHQGTITDAQVDDLKDLFEKR